MMLATRWDPFQDLRRAQDERTRYQIQMDSLLSYALGVDGQRHGAGTDTTPVWAPTLDISERKDAYLVSVELPGVKLDDLTITLDDGLLTIQGERHVADAAAEQQFHRVERRYGAFRRAITLPAHVVADAVEASIADGVLQLLVPKAEDAKPRRIEVRPGSRRDAIEAVAATSSTSTS